MELIPFEVHVDDAVVDDLRARLRNTRWPDQVPGSGWDHGADRAYLRDLCAYWVRSNLSWLVSGAGVDSFGGARAGESGWA
jgi:microsomal epoxide hydrolase